MLEPRQLHNITHPFIASIYMKKEFTQGRADRDVLVIEARGDGATATERNQQLFSLLADLDLIRDEVEKKAGKFGRVDIRCH